jgi:hypothetical protein
MSRTKAIITHSMSGTAKRAVTGGPGPDEIRDAILRHLYDVHRRAKSPRSASIGIQDLQRALKAKYGYKQQDVASDLDYLIQKGWAVEVVQERTFQTPGGTTRRAEKITYKISDLGIDHLQGASMYERPDLRPYVNITNVRGVTVVGDGNVVNAGFTDLSRVLKDLRTAVLASMSLNDPTKLNVAADIDTIQTQLQKPEPDRSIMRKAWEGIKAVVTVGELADLGMKAAALFGHLLT